MMEESVEDEDQVLTEIIVEEYKVWKKNCPFLYDLVMAHALEWPSLTIQWLPTRQLTDTLSCQKLLMGTHSSEEKNYVIISSVYLPRDGAPVEGRTHKAGESGGYGGVSGKVKTEIVIEHPGGEVNTARYQPQDDLIIATKGPSPDVFIFDIREHPSTPDPDQPKGPQVVCKGHTSEGYGLAWSPHKQGHLLSCSYDKLICIWDITEAGAECDAKHIYKGHDAVVEDISWHCQHAHMFASVGDDRKMNIWDTRENKLVRTVNEAHSDDVNAVDFNPFNEYLLATGGKDRVCKLWDLRNLSQELYHFGGEKHSVSVVGVQWSPHAETVLASWGFDRRVHVWDLARINMQMSEEDAKDGKPELLFIHGTSLCGGVVVWLCGGVVVVVCDSPSSFLFVCCLLFPFFLFFFFLKGGHTANVSDICWNPNDEWVMASVAEDNILHIWQMAENIYSDMSAPSSSDAAP